MSAPSPALPQTARAGYKKTWGSPESSHELSQVRRGVTVTLRQTLQFLLHQWLDTESFCQRPRFADMPNEAF